MKKREKGFDLVSVTAALRIHNPSQRRRRMLRDAMQRAHLAYSKALDSLLPKIGETDGMSAQQIADTLAMPILKPLPLSTAAKSGVCADIGAALASFRELREKQENAGKPTPRRLNPEDQRALYADALNRLAAADALDEINTARDDVNRGAKPPVPRPLHFVRSRKDDGFLLLRSDQDGRYFAWLNLHPKNSRFAGKGKNKDGKTQPARVDGLVNLQDGKPVQFASATGELFPLEFGREHQREKFLSMDGFKPKSAKLVLRDDAFDLMVSFEARVAKRETRTLLGVDRGMNKIVAFCAVDENGAALAAGDAGGEDLRALQKREEEKQKQAQKRAKRYSSRRRAAESEQAVHRAANAIVKAADENDSRVVLEDLSGFARGAPRKKGARRSNWRRWMNRRQFQKVARALEYKLRLKGLPPPAQVNAAFTSQTCPECGFAGKENRPKPGDDFKCAECGHSDDGDRNAARVIALKRMWRQNLPPDLRKQKMAELSQTENNFGDFIRRLREKRTERYN